MLASAVLWLLGRSPAHRLELVTEGRVQRVRIVSPAGTEETSMPIDEFAEALEHAAARRR